MSKIKAVFNGVVLKEIPSENQYGAIFIADMGKESTMNAEIIDIGPGYYANTGILIPTQLAVGDKVIIPKMGPTVVKWGMEDYLTCPENMILAKIEE